MAGDAWSSSVRGLSCSLQWGNERNPRCLLIVRRDCPLTGEEGGDDSRSACPLMPWAAHVIQWVVQKEAMPQGGANPKNHPQYGSRSATDLVKPESLVIVGQHTTVNTFSSLVLTARQVREVGGTRNLALCRTTVNSMTRTKS